MGVYNIFVNLYLLSIRIASLFNSKAKLWITGRKNVISELKKWRRLNHQIIWVHCASLGEFEQGRPIIEALKINFPKHKIVLTFFSPSGYEVRKNYEGADFITYLPIDTKKNARTFVSTIKPQLVIFIKYEFWYNYINELYINKIPLIFASVIFRPSQHFFKPWGRWFAGQLNKVSFLFVQDENSLNLLESIGIYHADVAGDTRFDRVVQLPQSKISFPIVEKFKGDSKILMGGSTWPPGEKLLLELLRQSHGKFKLVIAPHLVDDEHINDIVNRYKEFSPVLYSESDTDKIIASKVLIINKIGFLSQLYKYAHIAYIGGGFGVGIHNLLEASTYGVPVLFGPNYKRFREAVELRDINAGFPVKSFNDMFAIFNRLISNDEFYESSSLAAKNYVRENSGATHHILNKTKDYIVAG